MKELDLLVQKDAELKKATEQIASLMERIANINVVIGSKDEIIKSKDKEIKRIEDESKKSEKVIVKSYPSLDSNGRYKCPHCGRLNYSSSKCEYCSKDMVVTTYSNLKAEETAMKSDIETKLKRSLAEAENTQLDLEIQVEELKKKIERKEKTVKTDMEEFEEKTRKRYSKLADASQEEIDNLKDELAEVKKNKTDEEVERLRKEEFATLKTTIEKLTKEIEDPKPTGGFFWRLISKFVDTSARKQAIKELEEAKELAKKVEYRIEHPELYRNETSSERKERERREQLVKRGKVSTSNYMPTYNPYTHSYSYCCN